MVRWDFGVGTQMAGEILHGGRGHGSGVGEAERNEAKYWVQGDVRTAEFAIGKWLKWEGRKEGECGRVESWRNDVETARKRALGAWRRATERESGGKGKKAHAANSACAYD
eukprot:1500396-Pleurochrysis_carterae.AAC.1